MRSCKYVISFQNMGIPSPNIGPLWRCFELTACGDSMGQLIEDACVVEVGHDGEDIQTYPICDAATDVRLKALQMIDMVVAYGRAIA